MTKMEYTENVFSYSLCQDPPHNPYIVLKEWY